MFLRPIERVEQNTTRNKKKRGSRNENLLDEKKKWERERKRERESEKKN